MYLFVLFPNIPLPQKKKKEENPSSFVATVIFIYSKIKTNILLVFAHHKSHCFIFSNYEPFVCFGLKKNL